MGGKLVLLSQKYLFLAHFALDSGSCLYSVLVSSLINEWTGKIVLGVTQPQLTSVIGDYAGPLSFSQVWWAAKINHGNMRASYK